MPAFRVEMTAVTFDEQIDRLIDPLREVAERFNRGAGGCRAVTWSRFRATTS
jgi:hypothetical protein